MKTRKKNRLVESFEAQVIALGGSLPDRSVVRSEDVAFGSYVSEWTGLPYAELSVLLAQLRATQCIHQTHHWQARGDSFYGDHLLFQRLYEALNDEIDGIAEKAIGLGCVENVQLALQSSQTTRMIDDRAIAARAVPGIPTQVDLAKKSLVAELTLLRFCALASQGLDDAGLLTRGLDNMLQGIEDTHEGHVYLLKQRVNKH